MLSLLAFISRSTIFPKMLSGHKSELFENFPARSFSYYLAPMHFSFLAVVATLTVSMSVIATPPAFGRQQMEECETDGKMCDLFDDSCCGFCLPIPIPEAVSIQSNSRFNSMTHLCAYNAIARGWRLLRRHTGSLRYRGADMSRQ